MKKKADKKIKKAVAAIKPKNFKQRFTYIRRLIFYYGLFAFVLVNIILSQAIPSLYFKFIDGDEVATATMLKKIRTLPVFSTVLHDQTQIYGSEIADTVYAPELSRKEQITKLEEALKAHPQSRDIVYALYQLYDEGGNPDKANYYFQKAKEIDPGIKR